MQIEVTGRGFSHIGMWVREGMRDFSAYVQFSTKVDS